MTSPWQRIRQFCAHLTARMGPPEHTLVKRFLDREEQRLFYGMHLADQRHSVEVARTLLARGEELPSQVYRLALLHDIGKQRIDFRLWERVLVVLWPRPSLDLPDEPLLPGTKRAWQLRRWHPEYGARLLEALPAPDQELIELVRLTEVVPPPSQVLALFHWADDRN